jgi:hypothetical protein
VLVLLGLLLFELGVLSLDLLLAEQLLALFALDQLGSVVLRALAGGVGLRHVVEVEERGGLGLGKDFGISGSLFSGVLLLLQHFGGLFLHLLPELLFLKLSEFMMVYKIKPFRCSGFFLSLPS